MERIKNLDIKAVRQNAKDFAADAIHLKKNNLVRKRSRKEMLESAYFNGYMHALEDVRDGLVVVDET